MLNVRVAASLCAVAFATAAGTASAAPARPAAGVARPATASSTSSTSSAPRKLVTAFTIIHSFAGTDGLMPVGSLIEDIKSNIFGVTAEGGPASDGSIFEVNGRTGATTNVHSFNGTDGISPAGGVLNSVGNIDLGGNFYGTTQGGGASGNGTVWVENSKGSFKTLYSFTGAGDGAQPTGRLLFFVDGNLYGTTLGGGKYGAGTVFQISTGGKLKTLYSFTGGNDGGSPESGLAISLNGRSINSSMFGTTNQGGSLGGGVIYGITTGGKFTLVHTLAPATEGSNPVGELITDDNGNLFGTGSGGGSTGAGTIFKVTPAGSLTLLYTFPVDPVTFLNPKGNTPLARLAGWSGSSLYGSAAFGGSAGAGTIFKLDGTTLTILHQFTGDDGQTPNGQLLISPLDGNIYGTTANGGVNGDGELFALPLSR